MRDWHQLITKTFMFSTSGGGDGYIHIAPYMNTPRIIARVGSKMNNDCWTESEVMDNLESGNWVVTFEQPTIDLDDEEDEQ